MNQQNKSVATGALWCFLLAGLLTIPLALPILFHPRAVLYGDPGDNYGTLAGIDQLVRFRADRPTQPDGEPLSYIVTGLIASFTGPVAAYNLVLLLGFPLAAAALFPAATLLTTNRAAAAVAALAFAFSPYHLAHARQHFAQSHVAVFALVAWAAAALVSRPHIRSAVVSLVALLTAGLMNGYFLIVGLPLVAVAWSVALLAASRKQPRWLLLGVATMVLAVVVGLHIHHRALHEFGTGSRDDLIRFSARPSEYLRPPSFHPWLGTWSAGQFARNAHGSTPIEQTLYLGLTLSALAAIGAVLLWRQRGARRRLGLTLLLVAVLSVWSSLPPPWGLGQLWQEWCPPFRAAARFGLVVQMCIALLAAAALSPLRRPALAVVVAMLGFEYMHRPSSHVVEPIELSQELRDSWATVADYPAEPYRHLRRFRLVRRAVALGELAEIDAMDLNTDAVQHLAAAGVTHVVVHDPALTLPPGVVETRRFGDRRVARIDAPKPPLLLRARLWSGESDGFEAPEGESRWLSGGFSVLYLEVRGDLFQVEGNVIATVLSVGGERTLTVKSRAGATTTHTVTASPSTLTVPVSVNTPGENLVFGVDPPGQPVDSILHNGDPRRLAVLFRDLRFEPICELGGDGRGVCYGDGFRPREVDDRRWMSATAELRLVGQIPRLTLQALAGGTARPLTIACAGETIAQFHLTTDTWQSLEIALPANCTALRLLTPPPETDSPVDRPDLAIAIREVVVPALQSESQE